MIYYIRLLNLYAKIFIGTWSKIKITFLHVFQSGMQIMKNLLNIDEIWNRMFCLPFKICRKTKIQSFQYKLIHRVIACNAWLKTIRIKNTPTCQYCNEYDDIQHLFLFCSKTHDFWEYFSNWWKNITNFFLQIFLMILKNVSFLDSLVIVMIY